MAGSTIEPLTLTLMDGAERGFRLTMKEIRALTRRFGSDLMNTSVSEYSISVLWEALLDKPSEMTEDDFAALLPPDPEILLGFFQALQKHCSPASNEKYRPTKAAEKAAMNGSSSSTPSGASASDVMPMTSGT